MAKEQLHNWGRYILLAIVIIFGTGGWAVTVRSNTEDIVVLQEKTDDLTEDVHKLELSDKDIANLAQKSVDCMLRIDKTLDSIQAIQAKQADILSANRAKLETLTKD